MNKLKFKNYLPAEIKQMRKVLKQSRAQFADYFFSSAETIRSWEQGRRNPGSAAMVILQMIEQDVDGIRNMHNRCRDKLCG
jgi:putative transcriptional regulator